tara:strand:- start:12 stop:197 length:186 start_codon:yes stop_codon:yes gene_type:complete
MILEKLSFDKLFKKPGIIRGNESSTIINIVVIVLSIIGENSLYKKNCALITKMRQNIIIKK